MRAHAMAAWASLLCGCGSPTEGSHQGIETTRQQLVGGAVDLATTGVVGLAVKVGSQFVGQCTGTLIAPNLVLTARHCVAPIVSTPDERVQCGVARFAALASARAFFASPSEVRPLEQTDPSFFQGRELRVLQGTDDVCGHDVALLLLDEDVPESRALPVVPRIDGSAARGEPFVAEGYGYTDASAMIGDGTRMRLDDVKVRCVGDDCVTTADVLRPGEWLSTDARLCPGDSGGPALAADGRVFGVASRAGDGCTTAIYSDVAAFRDLLIDAALDAAELGGYEAPGWSSGISALGTSCEGVCQDDLVCYAEADERAGSCVPRCKSDASCPAGYSCATDLSACTPERRGARSEGCSVGRGVRTARGAFTGLIAAMVVALGGCRRRRNTRAIAIAECAVSATVSSDGRPRRPSARR